MSQKLKWFSIGGEVALALFSLLRWVETGNPGWVGAVVAAMVCVLIISRV